MYLRLLRENMQQYKVSLLGYCLMSNHVHLVMVPYEADSLALTLKHTHGRYAGYWNAKHGSSGHVWQGEVLLLFFGSAASVEGIALYRAEPTAGGFDFSSRGLALVQCRRALWDGSG
ncbi:transposase [Terriglobus sp. 2YAB30_2]